MTLTVGHASLDDIEAALFAVLSLGTVANGGPFRTVGRWTGEPGGPLTAEAFETELFGVMPSALLAFAGETTEVTHNRTLGGGIAIEGTSAWTIMVAVSDPRGTTRAVKGSTGLPGALALANLVGQICNNLIVPAPAATHLVAITGTPNTTDAILSTARLSITLAGQTPFVFAPAETTVTYASNGTASIHATSITANTLGNLAPGTVLTWTAGQPAHAAATGTIASTPTPGVEGLVNNERIRYVGAPVIKMIAGRMVVLGARFTARRRVINHEIGDEAQTFQQFTAALHLKDTGGVPMQTVTLTPTAPFPNGFGYGITINGTAVGAADAVDLAHACTFLAASINVSVGTLVRAVASATTVTVYTPSGHANVAYTAPFNVSVATLAPTVPPALDPIDQFTTTL